MHAPNYTPPPTSAFCDKACIKAQLCPNGSKCPATLCCEFRPVTKAPFEASPKVSLRMLTGHWDLGNFIRALARDPTMKDLGGSDRLDSRLSFYLNIQPEQFGVHGTVSVAKLFGKINSLAETETALTPPGKAAFMQAHEAIYFG